MKDDATGPSACADTLRQAVDHAISARKSVRAFLPDEPPLDDIRRILALASTAPSGSNIQPWRVHIVRGAALQRLARALQQAYDASPRGEREYDYYPTEWRSPYIERRRAAGWGLYSRLGIQKGDREASSRQHRKNFEFFGAPLVLVFTIDDDLNTGSWLDYGMFLQNIMILATGRGLATCPQAAIAQYPQVVRSALGIPDRQVVICDIAIGHEDLAHPANGFRTSRETIDQFVELHDR